MFDFRCHKRLCWLAVLMLLCGQLMACKTQVNMRPPSTPADQAGVPASAPEGDGPNANPRWYACRLDTDCTVEPGLCQDPTALNRSALSEFSQFRNYWNAQLECQSVAQPTDRPVVRCLKQRCTLPADAEP